jgi:uncharacterized repeat protein (TIGR03803 family)
MLCKKISCLQNVVLALAALLLSMAVPTQLAQAQKLTVLHTFTGGADGGSPDGNLIRDVKGNLYGTAEVGGTGGCIGDFGNGCGVVFRLDTHGTEAVLYSFTGYPSDGQYPLAGLFRNARGVLYGTTVGGGTDDNGTVFKLDTNGKETVLHGFGGNGDGGSPGLSALIQDSSGNLFDTTEGGGKQGRGTVYRITPSGDETVLYSFVGGTSGAEPIAGLVEDEQGNLYGSTAFGGDDNCNPPNGCGTIFKLAKNGAETVLYSFTGGTTDGTDPRGTLVRDADGNLYGVTLEGGEYGLGTVFKIDTNGKETVLHSFAGGSDGAEPDAGLVRDDAGNLYGTASQGGSGSCFNGFQRGCGTVFEINPSGTETILYSFTNGADGSFPFAGLLRTATGDLYGATVLGGSNACGGYGCGAIFKLTVGPAVSFDPTSLSFGNQTVGIASSPQVVTMLNTGNAPLEISSISIKGANSSDFAQTNNCPKSLPPTDNCRITVTFTPSNSGTRNATVSVRDNASNSPQTVPLTGVGVLPAVDFSPTSLTFPTQVVYIESAPQRVQLTNTGAGILLISKIAATLPFSQSNNCGKSVNPRAHCTITVRFYPKTKGVQQGTVTVIDNGPNSPQQVPLTGTGTIVQLEPKTLNFGSQPVGTRSLRRTVTLTNKGHAVVNITSISITGVDARDFAENNNCGKQVESGGSCFIRVTFKPLARGKRAADLTVKDDGGGNSQNVKLSGTGT